MMATLPAAAVPPVVADWLRRQTPAVQEAVYASVDFATDTLRDAGFDGAIAGATDCLRRLAELDVTLPSGDYFKIAHDLLDKAGAVAFQIGVAHYGTENQLRAFLALAGTALLADKSAIRRFELGFRPDSPLDDVVLYLEAELEMLDGGFPGE